MSLQELQAEIDRKAEEEASRVLDSAKEEAQRIISEAQARAAGVRDERTLALKRELDAQEKAQLAIARMKRKGELLQVKAKWTKRVFEEAEKRISEIAERGATEYRDLLNNLALEGVDKITGNSFIVEANSRDQKIITPMLGQISQRAARLKNGAVVLHAETLLTKTMGGVVVSTQDRTQYFNNTLEARLSTVARSLEAAVQRALFGAGDANE